MGRKGSPFCGQVVVHYYYPSTGIKPVLSGTLTKGRTPSSKLMNIKVGREQAQKTSQVGREQAQKTSHLSEYIYIYKIYRR